MKQSIMLLSVIAFNFSLAQDVLLEYEVDTTGIIQSKTQQFSEPYSLKRYGKDSTQSDESGQPNIDDYILYPNPTVGRITIHFVDQRDYVKVSIIDSRGRLVRQYEDFELDEFRVDLMFLDCAMYFCAIESGDINSVEKIVIQ